MPWLLLQARSSLMGYLPIRPRLDKQQSCRRSNSNCCALSCKEIATAELDFAHSKLKAIYLPSAVCDFRSCSEHWPALQAGELNKILFLLQSRSGWATRVSGSCSNHLTRRARPNNSQSRALALDLPVPSVDGSLMLERACLYAESSDSDLGIRASPPFVC